MDNNKLDDETNMHQVKNQQQIIVKKKNGISNLVLILIVFLGLTLPFHYVPSAMMIFPKENLTFHYTIITHKDIDKLLERYNDCTNIFQRESIKNEPLFKKLMEKGIIGYYGQKDIYETTR